MWSKIESGQKRSLAHLMDLIGIYLLMRGRKHVMREFWLYTQYLEWVKAESIHIYLSPRAKYEEYR